MRHVLKTDPGVFRDVFSGDKTFEIRLNDRDFQLGDMLLFRETKHTGEEMKAGAPLKYTGAEIDAEVGHILEGPIYGLMDGWVIMSIVVISRPCRR